MNTLKSEITSLFAKLLGIGEQILQKVLPIIEGEAGTLLQQILPIAEQVVLGLVSHPGTGQEKLNLAIPQIASLAKAAGINAGTAAIINAVQIVTANLPATPAA